MKCIYCGFQSTKVTNTVNDGIKVLRCRKCEACGKRFWTKETCSMDEQQGIRYELSRLREAKR